MTDSTNLPLTLQRHIHARLGAWHVGCGLAITVSAVRDRPEWDGGRWPMLGLTTTAGVTLSLSPRLGIDETMLDEHAVLTALSLAHSDGLSLALGRPEHPAGMAVFRWTTQPRALPDVGSWVNSDDARLPTWLRSFEGRVLVAWDEFNAFAGGVGFKRHNRYGHELAVGVDPHHRGQGLGRALVAQAARHVRSLGAIPIYLHEPANVASACLAESAGFPDQGTRLVWLGWPR